MEELGDVRDNHKSVFVFVACCCRYTVLFTLKDSEGFPLQRDDVMMTVLNGGHVILGLQMGNTCSRCK